MEQRLNANSTVHLNYARLHVQFSFIYGWSNDEKSNKPNSSKALTKSWIYLCFYIFYTFLLRYFRKFFFAI